MTGVFGFYATKVKMTYDNAKIIPHDDPDHQDYLKFKQIFGEDGNILVIGVQSPQIFEKNFFNDWYQLSNEIEQTEGVEKVISISKVYNLFRNDSLRKLEFKPLITQAVSTQEEMDSIKAVINSLKFYQGILINPDSNVTLIAVTLEKSFLDSKARIPLVKGIDAKARAFGEKYKSSIHISGLPYVRTIMSSKVADEIKIFTYLSILITIVFIFIFFRFISAVIVSLVVVIIGVVATLGCLAMLDYKITLLTGILPPLMVIIGIQNCIYLLNVYHQEYTKHGNKIKAITRLIS
ncbi:MAG: MMPL family transporter, partial [Bacteroidetes bacterium]|nr:MMPL family transporter [Bacteroidota bacterium]